MNPATDLCVSGVSHIVFYDIETSIPRKGEEWELLEFGAVIFNAKGFQEIDSFCTFIKPRALSAVSERSTRCNGIRVEDVKLAPPFEELADKIYSLLHGRIWAGHNIAAFDNVKLEAAFSRVNRAPPTPVGIIDTLPLLRNTFGPRAGNMKMSSLGRYCGLGEQAHRSLEDVRMNVAVLKQCAAILLLEQCFPSVFHSPPALRPLAKARRKATSAESPSSQLRLSIADSSPSQQFRATKSWERLRLESGKKQGASIPDRPGSDLLAQFSAMSVGSAPSRAASVSSISKVPLDRSRLEHPVPGYQDATTMALPEVLVEEDRCRHWGNRRYSVVTYRGAAIKLRDSRAQVRYSVGDKFAFGLDGRPTFCMLVELSPDVLHIIRASDAAFKQRLLETGGETTSFRPTVVESNGEPPAVRLKIRSLGSRESSSFSTIFLKESLKGEVEPMELAVEPSAFRAAFPASCLLDAYFSIETYDYAGYQGLRLLADRICRLTP